MKRYHLTTFGCQMNEHDSERMKGMLDSLGYQEVESRGEADPDEDVLGDAVAFEGVSKYPARIKCALLGWMAWKDATAQAMEVGQ